MSATGITSDGVAALIEAAVAKVFDQRLGRALARIERLIADRLGGGR